MIAPENDNIILNKFNFSLGINKFSFATDLQLEIVSNLKHFLFETRWHNVLAVLYTVLVLLK